LKPTSLRNKDWPYINYTPKLIAIRTIKRRSHIRKSMQRSKRKRKKKSPRNLRVKVRRKKKILKKIAKSKRLIIVQMSNMLKIKQKLRRLRKSHQRHLLV